MTRDRPRRNVIMTWHNRGTSRPAVGFGRPVWRRAELAGLLYAYERLARGGRPEEAEAPAGAPVVPEYDPEIEEQMRALGYLR